MSGDARKQSGKAVEDAKMDEAAAGVQQQNKKLETAEHAGEKQS